MKYLVSLPESSVSAFTHLYPPALGPDWYRTSDPPGHRVGSGGGTAWLLNQARLNEGSEVPPFREWLSGEKRIIIHGGGRSRRLPSYASMGKLLLPVPVFRWAKGQRINQTLLDLQLPLLESILEESDCHTLIASGDALIRSESLPPLPQADIICVGVDVDPDLATRHGVFITSRKEPGRLEKMLQKPSIDKLRSLSSEFLFLLDTGIWLLSDRAVSVLMKKTGWQEKDSRWQEKVPGNYDLYGAFGLCLGENPDMNDGEVSSLSSAVLYLKQGDFYHFGTSPELVSSNLNLQNKVTDQQSIYTRNVKPHPAMFIQNSQISLSLKENNAPLWIENSYIAGEWHLNSKHVITGIPRNNWKIEIPRGICLEMLPVMGPGETRYGIRVYGWTDSFSGSPFDDSTLWMGRPLPGGIKKALDSTCDDIQFAPLFPILTLEDLDGPFLQWMLDGCPDHENMIRCWQTLPRLSAAQLADQCDLREVQNQRNGLLELNLPALAVNYRHSVFYQLDLHHTADIWNRAKLPLLEEIHEEESPILRSQNNIFRYRLGLTGEKARAYGILQDTILQPLREEYTEPRCSTIEDQIVWGRCPVRIDLAGGWTDTPPYCLMEGGKVVNFALELNGQPPIQAYIRRNGDHRIRIRSIDLGVGEIIEDFDDLTDYNRVGSPFSIPKAAICLAGFHPQFSSGGYRDLAEQLRIFGCGFDLTILAAVPKGSGLGTSSILAATILGSLSDFCNLKWDYKEICRRTLALEQLLTTGGGWQDQVGGVFPGIKLTETLPGMEQVPILNWLPDRLFTNGETKSCMLLYYTGITRVAKEILIEIVEGMFQNRNRHLAILQEMKNHAENLACQIQRNDFTALSKAVGKSWYLNNALDKDTNNPEVDAILCRVRDYCLGYKLTGAGGGGYLLMMAKDPEAALKIRKELNGNPPNSKARFVDMEISGKGLQISRS